MGSELRERTQRVIERCRSQGFAAAGIASIEPSHRQEAWRSWIGSGRQGEMTYLDRTLEVRLDPNQFLPGARAAVVVADAYVTRSLRFQRCESIAQDAGVLQGEAFGRIARYARGRDYHSVMTKRLHALSDALRAEHPNDSFRTFVDIHPVIERELAARAGLGWIGKHTLLIHPRIGSYLLLGGIMTTLELEPVAEGQRVIDHCGSCTRCIDACPTGCITPYSVDAQRCIAYLTIERRSRVPEELRANMHDWIFGCDVCQEVCPHNSLRAAARQDLPAANAAYAPLREGFDLLSVLGWREEDRAKAFRTTPLRRAPLDQFRRNAAYAAGNLLAGSFHPGLHTRLQAIAADPTEPELVRDAASWALRRASRDDAATAREP